MIRRISLTVLIALLLSVTAFSQNELDFKIPVFKTVLYFAAAVPGEDDYQIPQRIANNEYFLESVRLTKLAQDMFDYGEYEASAGIAEEAIRQALLSDEYVSDQLILEAQRLFTWADSNNVPVIYPYYYNLSKNYYDASLIAHAQGWWDVSIENSIHAIEILSLLELGNPPPVTGIVLPSQYTVRPWATTRDCLWNIAGYSWVYGDPHRWSELYEANKARMPEPNNPDLIHPGFILFIPGENRQGMWYPNIDYSQR